MTEAACPVLRVRGLRHAYGGAVVLRGLDLEVRRGEVYAFLGPNGAGKTTTVEILEGFITATAGEVRVLGADPAGAPSAWRDRVGIVLQDSAADPDLTVRQTLDLYRGYHTRPRGAAETLALVGLSDHAGQRATALSGGQRRRLDLALAVIGDPDLLFLDEPTTGFDPAARRAAWDVIDGLRRDGRTVFLTTHDLAEAEFLADRIGVLAGGRLVAEGTADTLGGRDRSASAIAFRLQGAVLPAALLERAVLLDGPRVVLASSEPLADLEALARLTRERGAVVLDLEVRRASLEDVYLGLTAGTPEGAVC